MSAHSDSSKKHICILRHDYYPGCPRVGREAASLVEAGYAVEIICLRRANEPLSDTIDNIRVHRLPQSHRRGGILHYIYEYGRSLVLMGIKLTPLALRNRYALVQVNTLPDTLVFTTLVPRLLGAKILLDMHEPTPELFQTIYGQKVPRIVIKMQVWLEQWAMRYAHHVITVNDTIRQRFVERGAENSKLTVVRNVPGEEFADSAEVGQGTSREIEPGRRRFTLFTHGTLQPRYGHALIIRALPSLQRHIDALHVDVLGEGESREELIQLAEQTGYKDLISWHPRVPYDQVAKAICRADVGLVPLAPTPFSELCQPNKLFDYVALKIPVVAARFPAIEEIFDDSCLMFFRAGDVDDFTRSVIELYHDPAKRRRLATNAYNRYQDLKWSVSKTDYLRCVRRLVNDPPTQKAML